MFSPPQGVSPIKVIIPLAGKGTRMRPHTHTKAKPLLPVAGKPVLDHVLESLRGLDVSEYIFITGHLKEQIEEYISTHYSFPARFIEQTVKDGTAGATRLAKPYIDEPVLIVFVDTIFDADLSIIGQRPENIIWCQEVEDYQRFGIVTHEHGYMTNIIEKPDEPVGKLANIGVYYIHDYALLFEGIEHVYAQDLKVKGEYYLPEVFMYMLRKGARFKVAEVDGWYDCGKPETTLETNKVLLARTHELRSTPRESEVHDPVFLGEDCTIERCVIGPNVSIARGCTLRNAVLRDCILDENATVADITLHDSILGESTIVQGPGRSSSTAVFLGDHSRVTFH